MPEQNTRGILGDFPAPLPNGQTTGSGARRGRIHDPGEDINKWREAARCFSEIMKQNADRVWKPEAGWRILH